jgi:hypothetical protein
MSEDAFREFVAKKGYLRDQFADAFARYLPQTETTETET